MTVIEVELRDAAAEAVRLFARITGREPTEVVSDALSTYEWVLTEQAAGRRIVAVRADEVPGEELAPLIANHVIATKHLIGEAT